MLVTSSSILLLPLQQNCKQQTKQIRNKLRQRQFSFNYLKSKYFSNDYPTTTTNEQQQQVVLYDSLSQTYKGLNPNNLAWYTCGPTVYDSAHLGHARTYVTFDIIHRLLLYSYEKNHRRWGCLNNNNNNNKRPIFIMNITDVDDKILKKSKELDLHPLDLARYYEHEFFEDLKSLNCLKPTIVTRVSEYIPEIIEYIQQIEGAGLTYVFDDEDNPNNLDDSNDSQRNISSGSVYFDVRAFEELTGGFTKYGKLAPPAAASDFFERTDDNETLYSDNKKKDPRDFVLWKKRKEGEDIFWESPWCEGRPGWHIECSAMIEAISKGLKSHRVQVHAGGVDLKFPHHCNEIAQAEAFHASSLQPGMEWINHWVHSGHLHISGAKMSKSLKNFITIRELLESEERTSRLSSVPDDFRLWCLAVSGSYRGPATYSISRLEEAKALRMKIVRFLLDCEDWLEQNSASHSSYKKWQVQDFEFYERVEEFERKCLQSLMGGTTDHDDSSAFDLDGSTFLGTVNQFTEECREYILRDAQTPVETVESVIKAIRQTLAIVGFTDKTLYPGASTSIDTTNSIERELIQEFIDFRSNIRQAALSSKKEKNMNLSNELLGKCDNLRDRLAGLGVEVVDGSFKNQSFDWKFCLPKKATSNPQNK